MTPECAKKLNKLKKILRETEGCAIAFSGGVDSSLLLTVADEVLGNRCLAVIATSSTYPQREYEQAVDWAKNNNIPHVIIASEELDIPEFSANPTDRCYYCKKELFAKVKEQADKYGLNCVADGSNADDVGDYRPGMNAACELGVLSPLKEASLTKEDIRTIAKEVYHLPMADKPSMACLASRFPYGSAITDDKLNQIEHIKQSENVMMIGDGLNDSGALAAADVGVVVSEDITGFAPASDAILKADKIQLLSRFLGLSRIGGRIITISFVISFLYNMIGLGFAFTGQLSPLVSAILMPLSSISIVLFTTLSIGLYAKRLNLMN